MAGAQLPVLDVRKLYENALTSVRLGVEDFERCSATGGDPARALSAVRNLFAGVLLLFKYKIASCAAADDDAAALIFNPPEVLPYPDGQGSVEWRPVGKFRSTTIDVATIEKRFKAFGIQVEWKVIEKLQLCRNHLEHLHPANTLGEVANFVAELFPVLQAFIQDQLEEKPAEVLGEVWQVMLRHHALFTENQQRCEEAWADAGVPAGMEASREACRCPACASALLAPSQASIDECASVEHNADTFTVTCIACNHTGLIAPLMLRALSNEHDYDPRDGGEPTLDNCPECGRLTFNLIEQSCHWCGAELEYTHCELCEEPLGLEDQWNEGLCGYHAHMIEKNMRD
ncbi:hypothetical protein [Pseudomonas urmiensis]|uniref:hypothetical protein n=1 Tax=Pseudomonas urmiensis TaxID=2745493 RepID=UPI003C954CCE